MLENNIDNINEFNDFISSLITDNNNIENHNINVEPNKYEKINSEAKNNYNSINDIKKEDIKFIQSKLKEFCILNKPVSLKECRDFIDMNYKEYKSYTIKDPNIIKNIYYRYTNSNSTLDLNIILTNSKTTDDKPFFRELIYINDNTDSNNNIHIGIIYASNKNINRLAAAEHWYIDGTFIHPPNFRQILLIMYLDIITNKRIPAFFCILNSKAEILYYKVLLSVKNIISSFNNIPIKLKSVTLDFELELNKTFENVFANIKIIGCLYHYKQIILRKLKKYGLYNKNFKHLSNDILNKSGKLPFIIHNKPNAFNEFLDFLSNNENYNIFKKYFERKWKNRIIPGGILDYYLISKDQRSNLMIENYNGRLLKKNGKYI